MSKRNRKKPGTLPPDDWWPDWMHGKLPWSLVGLMDVLDFAEKLRDTPKDDWDLSEKKIALDMGEGGVQVVKFNQCHPMNQIAGYIVQKYRGVPNEAAAAHGFRYTQFQRFMSDNIESLIRDGLAKREGKDMSVSHGVFHALAVLPYSETGTRNGAKDVLYSYRDVVKTAKEYNDAHPD